MLACAQGCWRRRVPTSSASSCVTSVRTPAPSASQAKRVHRSCCTDRTVFKQETLRELAETGAYLVREATPCRRRFTFGFERYRCRDRSTTSLAIIPAGTVSRMLCPRPLLPTLLTGTCTACSFADPHNPEVDLLNDAGRVASIQWLIAQGWGKQVRHPPPASLLCSVLLASFSSVSQRLRCG